MAPDGWVDFLGRDPRWASLPPQGTTGFCWRQVSGLNRRHLGGSTDPGSAERALQGARLVGVGAAFSRAHESSLHLDFHLV